MIYLYIYIINLIYTVCDVCACSTMYGSRPNSKHIYSSIYIHEYLLETNLQSVYVKTGSQQSDKNLPKKHLKVPLLPLSLAHHQCFVGRHRYICRALAFPSPLSERSLIKTFMNKSWNSPSDADWKCMKWWFPLRPEVIKKLRNLRRFQSQLLGGKTL